MEDYSQQKDLTVYHLKLEKNQPFAFFYKNDLLKINKLGQESLDFYSGWKRLTCNTTGVRIELFDEAIKKCIHECLVNRRDNFYSDYGDYLLIVSKLFNETKIIYNFDRCDYRPIDLEPDEYWQKYVNRIMKAKILW